MRKNRVVLSLMALFMALSLFLGLPGPQSPAQAQDNITFGNSEEHFSGTVDETADSIPPSADFAKPTYMIIFITDDSTHTIHVKLDGTGATTANFPIKAGDPPFYLEFNTMRMSVVCQAGQECDYRIIALQSGRVPIGAQLLPFTDPKAQIKMINKFFPRAA